MDTLTYDIISQILFDVTYDNTPLLTYRLKYVNKAFNYFINNEKYSLCKYLNDTEKDLNILYKKGNINIYKWLYSNNINIKYKNIMGLIKYNRYNILNYSLKYKINHNIIFNRFYLTQYNNGNVYDVFNMFNIGKSFLIYACENNYKEICDILLNTIDNNGNRYNYYDKEIETCIDICLKNNNINLLKYFVKKFELYY